MTLLNSSSRKWFDERIEAFIEGSLSASDTTRFEEVALLDDDLRAEIQLSKQIRESLQVIPNDSCPPFVAQNVMAHVRRDSRAAFWDRIQAFFLGLSPTQLKPVMAVALLLVVVIASTQYSKVDPAPQAEVNQALDEVKWALAYLSEVGKSTGTTVKSSVIENQVVSPMSRSSSTIIEN